MKSTLKVVPLALAVSATLGISGCLHDSNDNSSNPPTSSTTSASTSTLTRFASTVTGAEVTGMYINENGDFFFNVQHPAATNPDINKGSVGVLTGYNINNLPANFTPATVPTTSADMTKVLTAVGSYQVIAKGGDTLGGQIPGGLGTVYAKDGTTALTSSDDPDMNVFIPIAGKTNEGYLFTNWEDRPGNMSQLHIAKDATGKWSVIGGRNIDFMPVQGTWVNCFGTLSPWGTPLSSEELYFDNTADWNNPSYKYIKDVTNLQQYLGFYPNPYRYGYIVEITNPSTTAPAPVKHFAMGRFSHENSVVMPDNKTVYLSDDGSGTVFFKFVADTAGDLSSGTLYAAKVTQDAGVKDADKAGFNITWIKLAHASDTQIATWISQYDGIDQSKYVAGGNSYITDQQIADWAAGKASDDRVAFLESRKAAAAKGATAEFNKMEGVNINLAAAKSGAVPYAYMAMSDVSGAMADGKGSIDVVANKCGVVYRMKLDASYNIARMEPAVAGGKYDSTLKSNQCPVDKVANPDNIVVMKDGRVIIGEDTSYHANNMIWVYKP